MKKEKDNIFSNKGVFKKNKSKKLQEVNHKNVTTNEKKLFSKNENRINDFKTKRRIGNQISRVVLILAIVPLLFVGIINYYIETKRNTENIEISNLNMAKSISNQVEAQINGLFDMLKSLYLTNDFLNIDSYTLKGIPIKIASEYDSINAIQIYDSKGNQILSSKNTKTDINVAGEEWFKKALEEERYVSDSYIEDATPEIIISMPIKNRSGSLKGVIAANISLKNLSSIAEEFKTGETGNTYIVDRNGVMIVHIDYRNKVFKSFNAKEAGIEGVLKVLEGNSDVSTYKNENNETVIGAYSYMPSTGFGIIVEQNKAEITKSAVVNFTITLAVTLIAVLIIILLTSIIARKFSAPIVNLVHVVDEIGNGDLTKRAKVDSHNEIGKLQQEFNKMVDSLYNIISNVNKAIANFKINVDNLNQSVKLTVGASTEITRVVDQVASGAEDQLKNVEDTIGLVEGIAKNVKNVDDNAHGILMATSEASHIAKDGSKDVESTRASMYSIASKVKESAEQIATLNGRTKEIGNIITFIDNISKQTNLLALNAAIEAARAGEYGRGFTVVAEEVRNLAVQTSDASNNIVNLISQIQEDMDRVSKSMEEGIVEVDKGSFAIEKTISSFEKIADETDKVFKGVEDFAVVVEELSDNMHKIEGSIAQVSAVSQQTAAGTQTIMASTEEQQSAIHQINQAIEELNQMTDNLNEMIKGFKIN
ncbi:methyl-accepting chemotaxis protein [Proteiniborus sp. MB09-C3]|uniref:methyl-accepting chemotaxis protein n=1 Tax=Proteiniborus sp. MB09-C3 TaxID=3050072 RepID=UPI002555A7B2|nr:methyl-accepting chemotaxis protein [Proteiniborus sp. MB09-C3]WIV12010.1 methyl-accepting chemotaxis protein [Proteiniborus sp. MB09-C3]